MLVDAPVTDFELAEMKGTGFQDPLGMTFSVASMLSFSESQVAGVSMVSVVSHTSWPVAFSGVSLALSFSLEFDCEIWTCSLSADGDPDPECLLA